MTERDARDPGPGRVGRADDEPLRPQRAPGAEARPATPNPSAMPTHLGPYRLLRPLGRGGMATVYAALREGLWGAHARVALKRLHPELHEDGIFVALFRREAEILSRLDHPHILAFQAFERLGRDYVIVTEWVDGCDLGRLLGHLSARGERLPPALVADILAQALRGLGAVHGARRGDGAPMGLVHRDLKPQNLLLGRQGQVKLGDFGVAKEAAACPRETGRFVKGTLNYMSPEQVRLEPLSAASDLFSVGIILAEMLMGRRVLEGPGIRKILRGVLALRPRDLIKGLPPEGRPFAGILSLACHPEGARRYGSALEMADDLNALRRHLPTAPSLEAYLEARLAEMSGPEAYEMLPTLVGRARRAAGPRPPLLGRAFPEPQRPRGDILREGARETFEHAPPLRQVA